MITDTSQSKIIDKIESIAASELAKISQNTIIREGNVVECFRYYTITYIGKSWQVSKHEQYVADFESLRTAVSWCIADKSNYNIISQQIKYHGSSLVPKLSKLKSITQFANRICKTDKVRYEIAQHQISYIRAKINGSKEQLNKLIDLTKYIQFKGFNDETPRFRKEEDSKNTKNV